MSMTNSPKKEYKTPETLVVKVNTEGVICYSNQVMIWSLTDSVPITSNSVDVDWGRGGYGSADEL